MRFPPIEAALRSCGDALRSSACEIAGQRFCTSGCAATSAMRASAPMRMPPATSSMPASGRALMSTRCAGRSTFAFIRSTRFVPPAMNRPFIFVASAMVAARRYSNGCTRSLLDRRDDADVAAAAADVAAHPLADLVVARGVPLAQQRRRGAELPGRAVAALEAVVADERGLQRVEAIVGREPFDGDDLLAAVHDREGEAGVVAPPVDQHGAGAACALVAPFLRAGEVEVLAQRVEQRGARVEAEVMVAAVDVERDGDDVRVGRDGRLLGYERENERAGGGDGGADQKGAARGIGWVVVGWSPARWKRHASRACSARSRDS